MSELDTDQLHRSPVHKGLGMSVVEYKRGFVIVSMPLSEEVRRGYEGTIHGGILATFADAACASCLVGCYDLDSEFTVTTDMHVRYYRQPGWQPVAPHPDRKYLVRPPGITGELAPSAAGASPRRAGLGGRPSRPRFVGVSGDDAPS
jgi:hypothetical protein